MKSLNRLFTVLLILITLLGFVPTVSAKNPPASGAGTASSPATHRPRKRLYFGMGTSTAECVVGIVLSKNPATAAEIGLPILLFGNIVAVKLYNNHPRWSGLIQNLSGLGCLAGALTRHAPTKPSVSAPPTANTPSSAPPSDPTAPPTSTPPTVPPSTPPTTPPTVPPSEPPTPPTPPSPPPVTHFPCTVHGGTDCGFGNGGINPSPNPLPPFSPPGAPHTNGKLW